MFAHQKRPTLIWPVAKQFCCTVTASSRLLFICCMDASIVDLPKPRPISWLFQSNQFFCSFCCCSISFRSIWIVSNRFFRLFFSLPRFVFFVSLLNSRLFLFNFFSPASTICWKHSTNEHAMNLFPFLFRLFEVFILFFYLFSVNNCVRTSSKENKTPWHFLYMKKMNKKIHSLVLNSNSGAEQKKNNKNNQFLPSILFSSRRHFHVKYFRFDGNGFRWWRDYLPCQWLAICAKKISAKEMQTRTESNRRELPLIETATSDNDDGSSNRINVSHC